MTYFRVGLDDEATELLLALSVMTGHPPAVTFKMLVEAILIEDAEAHGERKKRDVSVQLLSHYH